MKDLAALLDENTKLSADLATAQASLTSATTERDKLKTRAETAEADAATAKATATTLTTENAALRTKVATLEASQTDFDSKVAAKVASLGIKPGAGAAAAGAAGASGKLTLTQECAAARGIK